MRKASGNPRATARLAALRIHSAAIRVLRGVRQEDQASGLSPARLSALSVLVFRGPLTLKDLAAAEGVKPPTMSRIVGGLVRSGLARRGDSPLDGRALRIAATAKGRAVLRRARERRVRFLAGRFGALSAGERRTILAAALLLERAMAGAVTRGPRE